MSILRLWSRTGPPMPAQALRYPGPRRESVPMTFITSFRSAPVFSHSIETALTLEMRWAMKAFCASLDSSADHTLLCTILSPEIQGWRRPVIESRATCPAGVSREPRSTLVSALERSWMALPPLWKEGRHKTSKVPGWPHAARTLRIVSPVQMGRGLHSTRILHTPLDALLTRRAMLSHPERSGALPLPVPDVLRGVLMETNMT
mmetsp:Transcript_30502/g.76716  ORF Transcript_30502/g.76716 Transcript_30502/m.76716 type:complete len:204 (+) Transcript_30502:737-1348(+)